MNLPQINDEADAAGRRGGKSAAAFRTISEVAADLDVPPHVLRFWESKFSQIKPLKRGGGRRYYRPEDIDLLRRIRTLLYRDGYTIKGVQKLLRSPGPRALSAEESAPEGAQPPPVAVAPPADEAEATTPASSEAPAPSLALPPLDPARRAAITAAIDELTELRAWLVKAQPR